VADPSSAAASGLDELQIEALIVAGFIGDLGEARGGSHGRDAIGR